MANGRIDVSVSKRFLPGGESIVEDDVRPTGQHGKFEVVSQQDCEKPYEVRFENDFSMCTCSIGFNGAPCEHQFAVMKYYGLQTLNFLPIHEENTRRHLLFLATGTSAVPERWFAPLPTATCIQFTTSETNIHTDGNAYEPGLVADVSNGDDVLDASFDENNNMAFTASP